jgi:hypothetical protein
MSEQAGKQQQTVEDALAQRVLGLSTGRRTRPWRARPPTR